ncbi:(2,3-dihydroxybenzoyl)adenylate synthase [Corynebacterium sp. A21]|uniref:(2,3-dihydroxybenzoyl)adenylate synthase n=1 Tax=Corynebacterium sp. A21 TaxID=3457318 RepID=UPI003FD06808
MDEELSRGIVRWPEEYRRRYRAAGYWEDRSIGDQVFAVADRVPDKTALVDATTGERFSYRDLAGRADAAAARLLGLGLVAGDRVILALPNGADFLLTLLACLRAGIIPVLALSSHRKYELKVLGGVARARAYIAGDVVRDFDHRELGEELRAEIDSLELVIIAGEPGPGQTALGPLLEPADDPVALRARFDAADPAADDPAVFLLSGGTTGVPKLIVRTHNDYVYNARVCLAVNDFRAADVCLVTMPIGHNFPLACPGILGALLVGAASVIIASPNPRKVFPVIAAEGVTHTALVPAVAQSWIDYQQEQHTNDLGSLRVVQVGGSRMPDSLAVHVEPVLGARLQQVFGMAEGLINMTRLDDPEAVINTTQGRPVSPGDEIRIVDENFQDVPAGERGEILTRGPYTPRGYYANPEANDSSFHEGWYGSGDVIHRRSDGNLVVHGRNKDIINRGGEKVSAEELESFIYYLPGVHQVAAVAMPHPALGEEICLVVELEGRAELTVTEVTDHLDAFGVARYKHPARIFTIDEIPMTRIGKMDKKVLREFVRGQLGK